MKIHGNSLFYWDLPDVGKEVEETQMKIPEILYEDDDILLCRKEAGVATQTRRLGQQDMESLLKNYRSKKGEPPYIGVVHRLDQPVEGVMVFAKTPEAAGNLSMQIRNGLLGKHYYAASYFMPSQRKAVLENELVTDKKTNYTRVAVPGTKGDGEQRKKAKLEYEVIGSGEKTYFDILLHTGRQHQIRVQMAHIGCPLIGDTKYGEGVLPGESLGLCSYRLQFCHPVTGKPMDISIEPKGKAFEDMRGKATVS